MRLSRPARLPQDSVAIGDARFAESYVDGQRFNVIYAETLFQAFDSNADGFLSHAEAQAALHFLGQGPPMRPPTEAPSDGVSQRQPGTGAPAEGNSPAPLQIACPADATDPETGELRVTPSWFGLLYRAMA